MRLKLSESDFAKKIIFAASAFAVSGVITAGAAWANDGGLQNAAIEMPNTASDVLNRAAGMPNRTIAMSNLPGLSGPSVQATIDNGTVSDTASADPEPDSEDIADKAKNFVSPDKRAMARKYFSQSMALKKQGDSGGALIGFLKATREDPTLLDAYYEQALIFREKGFHKLAASRLEQSLSIKPKYQKARLLLATVKLEQGNVPDAVQQLGKSLGLDEADRKPKEKLEAGKDEELPPPMILQALHPAMPVPAFVEPQKAVEAQLPSSSGEPTKSSGSSAGQSSKSIDLTTFDLKPAAAENNGALNPVSDQDLKAEKQAVKPKKVRKGTRQRIRELIARKRRKYGRYSKQKKPKRWIAKIFSVPEPLRFLGKQGSPEKTAAENELQPLTVASKNGEGKESIHSSGKESPSKLAKEPASKEPANRESARREMTSKELERKFETAVSKAFSEKSKETTTADAHPKSRWTDWHRPLTPKESKEEKANEEFERARKTASAYKPSESPYEPELWRRKEMEQRNHSTETDTFKLPNDGSPKSGWLGITSLASNNASSVIGDAATQDAQTSPAGTPDEDEWTKRLRDLNENGTGTLKTGEAFMFSEDTGEAVLFLADGQKIRRIIAEPVSSDELLKLRRPDVMVPKELYYDTSLLGKVVPPIPAPPPPAAAAPTSIKQPPPFKMEDLVGGSNGFFGWLKGLVHL